MSYEQAKSVDAIRLTDYKDKPMEAYYIGSHSVDTRFGEQMLHSFQKEDGKKLNVWGFTALNRLLESTPRGIMTKITYTGKSEEPNKYGNKSHTCIVFFDMDNKLDGYQEPPEVDNNDDLPF